MSLASEGEFLAVELYNYASVAFAIIALIALVSARRSMRWKLWRRVHRAAQIAVVFAVASVVCWRMAYLRPPIPPEQLLGMGKDWACASLGVTNGVCAPVARACQQGDKPLDAGPRGNRADSCG